MDGDNPGSRIFRRDALGNIQQTAHHCAIGAHPAHIADFHSAAHRLDKIRQQTAAQHHHKRDQQKNAIDFCLALSIHPILLRKSKEIPINRDEPMKSASKTREMEYASFPLEKPFSPLNDQTLSTLSINVVQFHCSEDEWKVKHPVNQFL